MKRQIPLWVVLVVVAILLVANGIGGTYFYKDFKKQIQEQQKENEMQIKASEVREDSLTGLIDQQKQQADVLRNANERLQQQNNSLYYELKKRRKNLFIVDSDFMSNARRLSESTDRFYKANDTIR